jgi:hypothetical protein
MELLDEHQATNVEFDGQKVPKDRQEDNGAAAWSTVQEEQRSFYTGKQCRRPTWPQSKQCERSARSGFSPQQFNAEKTRDASALVSKPS